MSLSYLRKVANYNFSTGHVKVEKLLTKIKDQLNLDCDISSFKRLYPGKWQRSQGAWVWLVQTSDCSLVVGSTYSVTYLLGKKVKFVPMFPTHFGKDLEIVPEYE